MVLVRAACVSVAMAETSTCPAAAEIFLHFERCDVDEVRSVFNRYDDGNGLSASSMKVMLRDVGLLSPFDTAEDLDFLRKQLVAADRDGDGVVHFDEFLVYLNTIAAPRDGQRVRGKTFAKENSKEKQLSTKISFFAEDAVEDTTVPGTPEMTLERTHKQVSRHGLMSKIPTPPAQFTPTRSGEKSKTRIKNSPLADTKFGFNPGSIRYNAVYDESHVTHSSPASEPARTISRLARLAMTPRTPLVVTTQTNVVEVSEEVSASSSPTAVTPKQPIDVVAESPSPTPAFARPSKVYDATGDLHEFVRNLEKENAELRAAVRASEEAKAEVEAAAAEAAAIEATGAAEAVAAELAAAEALSFTLEADSFRLAEAASDKTTATEAIEEVVDKLEEVRREETNFPSTSAASKRSPIRVFVFSMFAVSVAVATFALLTIPPESFGSMWTNVNQEDLLQMCEAPSFAEMVDTKAKATVPPSIAPNEIVPFLPGEKEKVLAAREGNLR